MGRYIDYIRQKGKSNTTKGKIMNQSKTSTPPNLVTQAANYIKELTRWKLAGSPLREQAEIDRIFNTICSPCPHFEGNRCGLCKCFLNTNTKFNKIAFGTTKCPADPPRWMPEVEGSEDGILSDADKVEIDEIVKYNEEPEQPVTPNQPPPPAPKPTNSCGC